ncbi:iron chelate uptake ABC transporter family permease subunit [Lacrimispora sp.]|uniref:iron chelate uptake ABC transporter family permease subunit n=1 Tax=Lacrimispora sp. TaxID=2719234 RepID=UPI0039945DDF
MKTNLKMKPAEKHAANILVILGIIALIAIAVFIFQGLNTNNFDFNFPRRLRKIAAILLVSTCIGYSSVVFQTITENRILTPNVMGLDSLYMFIQSLIVYMFGAKQLMLMNSTVHFIISVGLMMAASLVIYSLVFRTEGQNIYTLVLAGMIMGTFFRGISSFLQMMIDPNEFSILQGKMFATFSNVNEKLLTISCFTVLVCLLISRKDIAKMDVLVLGKDSAISLGISYNKTMLRTMIIISVMVSVSTVLVGPVTFLGILLVSISRELMKTYRHIYLIFCAILTGLIALPLGQLVSERIFNGKTTLSVILNFVGGIYFIYLLLKESKQ